MSNSPRMCRSSVVESVPLRIFCQRLCNSFVLFRSAVTSALRALNS